MTTRRLQDFRGVGYDKGRSLGWQVAWWITSHVLFQAWWCPARLRPLVLRAFGARIGRSCNIRNGVRIHWPWKLTIGDHTWIGEGAWVLNLEPVFIGDQVCISQEAMLCTGSHRRRDPAFEYDNAPIVIGSGAWVALRAIVLRGVVVPVDGLVPAGTVLSRASGSPAPMPSPVASIDVPAPRGGHVDRPASPGAGVSAAARRAPLRRSRPAAIGLDRHDDGGL